MSAKIDYENSSFELLGKTIIWALAAIFSLGLAIPWVINSQIKYFSKGFTIWED